MAPATRPQSLPGSCASGCSQRIERIGQRGVHVVRLVAQTHADERLERPWRFEQRVALAHPGVGIQRCAVGVEHGLHGVMPLA